MIKRLLILILLLISQSVMAQKVAYIYSEQVFKAIPAYSQVVKELEQYMEQSSARSEQLLLEVQNMYNEYKGRANYMSSSAKESARKAIIAKEQEANNYLESAMERRQAELMAPLEKKVTAAIDLVAKEMGVDLILDLSVANVAIYRNKSLDYTSLVISKL